MTGLGGLFSFHAMEKQMGNRGHYKAANDIKAMERAKSFLASLAGVDVHKIVRYRTDRGEDIGVLVNVGEKVSIWNAFLCKTEHYTPAEYQDRLISQQ